MSKIYILLSLFLLASCNSDTPEPSPLPQETMYFPPKTGDVWETKSITALGWKQTAVQPLLDYLALKNSKGFIILVNGRIVMENYFNGHSAATPWYWASAGKTLTGFCVGIGQVPL